MTPPGPNTAACPSSCFSIASVFTRSLDTPSMVPPEMATLLIFCDAKLMAPAAVNAPIFGVLSVPPANLSAPAAPSAPFGPKTATAPDASPSMASAPTLSDLTPSIVASTIAAFLSACWAMSTAPAAVKPERPLVVSTPSLKERPASPVSAPCSPYSATPPEPWSATASVTSLMVPPVMAAFFSCLPLKSASPAASKAPSFLASSTPPLKASASLPPTSPPSPKTATRPAFCCVTAMRRALSAAAPTSVVFEPRILASFSTFVAQSTSPTSAKAPILATVSVPSGESSTPFAACSLPSSPNAASAPVAPPLRLRLSACTSTSRSTPSTRSTS